MTPPEPFVSADTDVRDLDGFMLNVERLLASELWALSTGDEFKAAMALWMRAWKQLPGGSLPNDDRVLAAFSGAGKAWPKVRDMALRGFVACSDGRLYHRVLCDDVKRAYERKMEYAADRDKDRDRLQKWRDAKRAKREKKENETRFNGVSEDVSEDVSEGVSKQQRNACETSNTGQGQGQEGRKKDSEANASAVAEAPAVPIDPLKDLFDQGVMLLEAAGIAEPKARTLIGGWRKHFKDPAVLAAIIAARDDRAVSPVEYIVACLNQSKANGNGRHRTAAQQRYYANLQAIVDADEAESFGGGSSFEALYGARN